ncbi:MAG: hypothetical protein PHR51_00110 [Patescibacteria group bacterium]|nr:hypothetical protein [Patescibacteria group bacterium]
MADKNKIEVVKQLLETATANLASAKQILGDLLGTSFDDVGLKVVGSDLKSEGNVIEGIFDGQNMLDKDGKKYPVPANYASKSKLVTGDVLKLTIQDDGSFVYKQIGPVERKKLIGTLVHENDEYKVVAGGRSFKVLMASVTYFKLHPGDQVTIMIPESPENVEWAAIESAVIAPSDI